jgi:predicted XRE-type DNA-binding protein
MKKTSAQELSKKLRISPARGMEAVIKAQLISAVIKSISKEGMTHAELAQRSGLSRSVVTGILSGSLQRVTIDRILRLVDAARLVAEVRVKAAA